MVNPTPSSGHPSFETRFPGGTSGPGWWTFVMVLGALVVVGALTGLLPFHWTGSPRPYERETTCVVGLGIIGLGYVKRRGLV